MDHVDDNGRYEGCVRKKETCITCVFTIIVKLILFLVRKKLQQNIDPTSIYPVTVQFPYPLAICMRNATLISSLADVRLQSLDAGGEEIFSTFRNDEILEHEYVLIIEGIITRHSPDTGTLTNKWVETIKVAIVMYQINRGAKFLPLTLGVGYRSQDGTLHCSPNLMCALISMKKQ